MSKESDKKGRKFNDMTVDEKKKLLEETGFGSSSLKSSVANLSQLQQVSPTTSLFDNSPKREIKLSESEERMIKKALDYFDTNSLYEAELLKLFEDWQSDRTKSIKKFLLSLISVLSLTVFAGINILEVSLFNITVAEGYQYYFLVALFCVIAGMFYYYEVNLWRDKKVKDSDLKIFMESLQQSDQYLKELDTILKQTGVTIEQLVDDFEEQGLTVRKKVFTTQGVSTDEVL